MLPFQVPAQVQVPPTAPLPLAQALARVLDEYDQHGEGAALTMPPVAPKDQAAVRWLLLALTQDRPDNPFPKGGRAHKEAEALRSLLQDRVSGPEELAARLLRTEMQELGSRMALWRWGRRLARADRFPKPLRRLWEDLLLAAPDASLASSYALRHALSFALAEADQDRFGDLKAAHAGDAQDIVLDFQRLFGLLGSEGPRIWIWSLPSLAPRQARLKDLGADRIWICPADPGAPPSPAPGLAWIVPARLVYPEGVVGSDEEAARGEAILLSRSLKAPADRVWFAPGREEFESSGMRFFPILLQLDFRGAIASIRIGEAAPESP